MAQPKRNDVGPDPAQPWSAPTGYRAGGEVGQMHADLARRLDRQVIAPGERTPGERAIRFVSVAGGVTLLAAAYLGVALLLWL